MTYFYEIDKITRFMCLPVIHWSLVQHTMAIIDDGVQNLLPAKHLCLEQLKIQIIILIIALCIIQYRHHY